MAVSRPTLWQRTSRGLKVVGGIVALLTAIAALIKVLHEVGWIGSGAGTKDERAEHVTPAEGTAPPEPVDRSTTHERLVNQKRSPVDDARKASTQPGSARPNAAVSVSNFSAPSASAPTASARIDRPAFTVRMPAKREYTTGNGINDGRFMLLGATLEPQTPESDLLKVQWRFISRSPYKMELRSSDFALRVNNDLLKPEHFFIHSIPSRESREGELDFVLNAKTPKAALRYGPMGIWEIPLELVVEPEAIEAASVWDPEKPGREPFDVSLPAKKEYAVSNAMSPAAFTVLRAKVTPQTPESDEISIQWRMTARGTYPTDFDNYKIWLNADGKKIPPEQSFTHRVSPGDTRDGEIAFITEPGVRKATIVLYQSTVEIPLDVAASRRP